jgi:preprotein translocase subunit SecE
MKKKINFLLKIYKKFDLKMTIPTWKEIIKKIIFIIYFLIIFSIIFFVSDKLFIIIINNFFY